MSAHGYLLSIRNGETGRWWVCKEKPELVCKDDVDADGVYRLKIKLKTFEGAEVELNYPEASTALAIRPLSAPIQNVTRGNHTDHLEGQRRIICEA